MEFCFKHTLELPLETVFAFHENPTHLTALHQNRSGFRLLSHEGNVKVGSTTWVEVTIVGFLPVVLGFQHDLYERPKRFGEHLIHGPFRKFIHIHEFQSNGNKTIVLDQLDISLPWQYGGELSTRLILEPIIQRVFHLRSQAYSQISTDGTIERMVKNEIGQLKK